MELAVALGATAAWGQPFAIRSSTIIRAIEPAALLGFYQSVYTIRITPGHGNPNSPHEPGSQSVAFEMFPANTPVCLLRWDPSRCWLLVVRRASIQHIHVVVRYIVELS